MVASGPSDSRLVQADAILGAILELLAERELCDEESGPWSTLLSSRSSAAGAPADPGRAYLHHG